MTELLTAAQMRAIEEAAIASGKVTGLELMERAGRGVVEAIFEEWPELAPSWGPAPKPPEYLLQDEEVGRHRAVVLCGPGNNGGDGFVVARLLKEAGWDVEVFLYGDAGKLPPDARVNYERWEEMGEVGTLSERTGAAFDNTNLVIDAVFGTGLARPLHHLKRLLRDLCDCVDAGAGQSLQDRSKHHPPVVAIDIPSGLCADSGKVLHFEEDRKLSSAFSLAAAADLTVTFHSTKIGHYSGSGYVATRRLVVKQIGLKSTFARANRQAVGSLYDIAPEKLERGVGEQLSAKIAMLSHRLPYGSFVVRKHWGHKYSHGHALILSGDVGKGGAARLAARGALRVGAGAVTVGCPPEALAENAAQLTAIMLQAVGDVGALGAILADARINALCIGPGFGLGSREEALLSAALGISRPGLDPGPQAGERGPGSGPGRSLVLDADALTLLARDEALFAQLHKKCVLTPHAGEFARLFPDIAEKLNAPATKCPAYSKVDATREAAARAGCVVLFKGPDTVIADPSGRCSINASAYERAAPWLATAGSGDVLAGFITGLLARGFGPMRAAETGAWLHTECALSFGPGLIAEDLPEELPKVLRNLNV